MSFSDSEAQPTRKTRPSKLPQRSITPSFSETATKGKELFHSATRRFTNSRANEIEVSSPQLPPRTCEVKTRASSAENISRIPRPLDLNKALPSKPVLQVRTGRPVKQSRTLLDASEQPLRNAHGEDWPLLPPNKGEKVLGLNSSSRSDDSGALPGSLDPLSGVHSAARKAAMGDLPSSQSVTVVNKVRDGPRHRDIVLDSRKPAQTPKPRPPVTKKRSPSWVPNNDRVLPAQPQTPRRTTADEKGSPSKRKKRPTPLIMTPKASSRANIEYEDIERLRIVDPRADPRMDNAHHTVRNLSPEQTEFLDRIDPRLKMTNGEALAKLYIENAANKPITPSPLVQCMTAASDAASDVASEDALQFATPRKGFTAESDTSMREAIYSDVADAGFSEGAADMASSADEYHTSRGFNTRHPLRCVSREFPRVQQTTGVPKSQSASPSTTTPGVLSPEFRYTKFTRERSVANLTAMFEPKKASGGEDASTEPASPSPTRPSVKDTEFSGPKLNVAEEANDVIFGEAGDTRANLAQISRPTRFVKRLSGTLNEKLNEHLNTTFGRVDLADQKLAITPNNRGSASDDAPLSSQFLSSLSPVDENKIKGVKSDPPLRCSTDKMDFTPRREGDVLDPEKYGSSRRDFYGDDIAASLTLKPLPKLPCDATTVAQNNNNNASNGHRKVSFKPSSFEASIIDSDMDVTDDEDKRKRHFEVAMHRLTEKSSDEPVDEETMTDWINSRYFRKSIDNAGITVAVGSDEEDINEQNNASAQHGGSHTTHGVDEVVEMQQKPHNLNHKQPTVEDDIQSTDQAQVGASHSPQPATAPSTLETVQRSPSFRPNSPISARYKTTATSHANLHRTSSNTHRVMAPAMSFGSLHSTAAASASTTANVNNRPDLRDLPYTTQSGIPQRANSRSTGYRQPTVSSTQRSSTQRTVSRLSTAPAATNAGPSRTASVDSASNARTASQIPRRDHTSQGSNRSTLVNDDNDLLAGFAAQGVNEARFAHVEHLTNRLAEVFGDLNNRVSVNENELLTRHQSRTSAAMTSLRNMVLRRSSTTPSRIPVPAVVGPRTRLPRWGILDAEWRPAGGASTNAGPDPARRASAPTTTAGPSTARGRGSRLPPASGRSDLHERALRHIAEAEQRMANLPAGRTDYVTPSDQMPRDEADETLNLVAVYTAIARTTTDEHQREVMAGLAWHAVHAYKYNRRARKWMLAAETAAHNAREYWAHGDLELRTLNRTLNLALDHPALTTQADRDAARVALMD